MNDIITIALKAFPVIALITTGVVLEKTAFISAEAVKGMKVGGRRQAQIPYALIFDGATVSGW